MWVRLVFISKWLFRTGRRRRLSEKAAAAIVEFVTGALADNPYGLGKPLTNERLGLRTARRGDYRVLFTLDIEEHILYVHRSNTAPTSTNRVSRSPSSG
ncbi:hypothetical protein GCM10023063_45670 [Arthrobacter methylotrophus]|uniref:type II toxin-antitoxin system RelE family toxin n=1 Tax=Arthrobacter methylotrophus TaxID=121291 RepID=UPI0031E8D4CC